MSSAALALPTPVPALRKVALLLGGFTVVLLVALAVPLGPVGPRVAAAVVVFHLGWVLIGRRDREMADLWATLAPVSALFVLPDWFLSAGLGVLRFPADGFPDLGPVTGYMAGLWAVPFLASVVAGRWVAAQRGFAAGALAASAVCLLLLVVGETVAWRVPVWEAVGVRQLGHVALYLLPAEALLGASVFVAAHLARGRGVLTRLGLGLLVAQLYAGGLALGYLLVEL